MSLSGMQRGKLRDGHLLEQPSSLAAAPHATSLPFLPFSARDPSLTLFLQLSVQAREFTSGEDDGRSNELLTVWMTVMFGSGS